MMSRAEYPPSHSPAVSPRTAESVMNSVIFLWFRWIAQSTRSIARVFLWGGGLLSVTLSGHLLTFEDEPGLVQVLLQRAILYDFYGFQRVRLVANLVYILSVYQAKSSGGGLELHRSGGAHAPMIKRPRTSHSVTLACVLYLCTCMQLTCRPFKACRMSPSAVNTSASSPSGTTATSSAEATC